MTTTERRTAERRISPAIGEHAIQECARLRAVNAELLAALQAVDRVGAFDVDYQKGSPFDRAIKAARRLIAKAKEPA